VFSFRDIVTATIGKPKDEDGFASNQEFIPSVGRHVWDKLFPDPLHASINAWRRWFIGILSSIAELENRKLQEIKKLSSAPRLREDKANRPLIKFLKVL